VARRARPRPSFRLRYKRRRSSRHRRWTPRVGAHSSDTDAVRQPTDQRACLTCAVRCEIPRGAVHEVRRPRTRPAARHQRVLRCARMPRRRRRGRRRPMGRPARLRYTALRVHRGRQARRSYGRMMR
jgi:hypothetical protein